MRSNNKLQNTEEPKLSAADGLGPEGKVSVLLYLPVLLKKKMKAAESVDKLNKAVTLQTLNCTTSLN